MLFWESDSLVSGETSALALLAYICGLVNKSSTELKLFDFVKGQDYVLSSKSTF